MKIFYLIAWTIIGILNLCDGHVSTFQYAMAWIMLMGYLILDCVGA